MRSRKDWTIVRRAIQEGFILVTKNSVDFRLLRSILGALDERIEANGLMPCFATELYSLADSDSIQRAFGLRRGFAIS
jgi:hypothetical protein